MISHHPGPRPSGAALAPASDADRLPGTVPYSHVRPVDARVDLSAGPDLVPLCAVTPGGGLFAAATLAVVAGAGPLRAGFSAPGGEEGLTDAVRVAAGASATLCVRRDALAAAFLARCGEADGDPRVLTIEVPLTRVVGDAGAVGEGRLTIRIAAVRLPAPPHLTATGAAARIEDETLPGRIRLATLVLTFGPDVALAPPDFRLALRVAGDGVPPAALGLRPEAGHGPAPSPPTVVAGDGTHACAVLGPFDGPTLAREGTLRLVVDADPASVFAAVTAGGAARRDFEIRAALVDGPLGPPPLAGDEVAVTATVEVEARAFVSVDAGGAARRLLLGGEEPADLDPVAARVHADEIGEERRIDLPGRLAMRVPARARVERIRIVATLVTAGGATVAGPEVTLRPGRRARIAEAGVDLARLLPLDALAAELGAGDRARVAVAIALTVEAPRGAGLARAAVRLPVELRREVEDLPVCIDFGASAIGVWIGRTDAAGARTRLGRLPLGRWHEAIDPAHDESALVTGDPDGHLIPSQIGLSSRHNLRAGYDPARLGDLSLALGDGAAVARRLERLGRRYDVSVPFPNAASLHDHLGEVVLDLKRRLTTGVPTFSLERPVAQRDGATGTVRQSDRIDVPSLFRDCVDEIVKLYVARAVVDRLGGDPARATPCPRLVLTHPSGIGAEQVERYRRAAAPLVARRNGTTGVGDAPGVVLYPEAVAAARFALDQPEFAEIHGRDADGRPHVLVALDIGAGTSDVAIVSVGEGRQPPAIGELLATFGLPLGGDRLDRALAHRLVTGLSAALGGDGMPAEAVPGLAGGASSRAAGPADRNRRLAWFGRQVRAAKIRLADALLAAGSRGYHWAADRGLDVLVHDGDAEVGVVAPTRRAGDVRAVGDVGLAGFGVLSTALRRAGEPGVRAVRLSVPAEVFERPGPAGTPAALDPRRVTEVLGTVLPSIALDAARRLAPTARLSVVVTGRTVLWPPLFAAIARTVAGHPAGAALVADRPMDAARMKRAVVAGAMTLAEERGYEPVVATHPNPLAAVTLVRRSGETAAGGGLDIAVRAGAVTCLAPFGVAAPRGERHVAGADVRLVRAIPCLDPDRLAAIDAVMPDGVPFLELRRPDGAALGNLSAGGGARLSVVGVGADGCERLVVAPAGSDRAAAAREIVVRGDTATVAAVGEVLP